MKVVQCLITASVFCLTVYFATLAQAEDAPTKSEGQVSAPDEARQLDVTVGSAKGDQGKWRARSPAVVFALHEGQNPFRSSVETVLGMDSTIAMFVGLSGLLVLVVAIVAASRAGPRDG